MTPNTISLAVLFVAVAAALAFGLWRQRTDGRLVAAQPGEIQGIPLGEAATFVQFSSPVCAPCATTRRLLEDVARNDGVGYVDLDVTETPELVERFDVTRTPTVLVLDPAGQVRQRIVGVPRRPDLDALVAGSVLDQEVSR